MGVLSNRVERSELAVGDHIYTWRTLFAYSHHGIYVGGNLVVHFTQQNIVSGGDPILFSAPVTCSSASSANECLGRNVSAGIYVSASSTEVSSACGIPKCAFQQKESGVVVSCLNCFLGGGRLYRFEYGVSSPFFLSRVRSGTCTTAQSDPPEEVIHRAMYLLQNGFGDYHIFNNNCEDFALYCKTGLHVLDQKALGRSSQAASVIAAPPLAICSLALKLLRFTSSPASLVVTTVGTHCLTRYENDIGVRTDVTRVKVEELTSFRNQKSSKKSINENHSDTGEVTLNQTDTPAKKRQGSM